MVTAWSSFDSYSKNKIETPRPDYTIQLALILLRILAEYQLEKSFYFVEVIIGHVKITGLSGAFFCWNAVFRVSRILATRWLANLPGRAFTTRLTTRPSFWAYP